MKEMKDRVLMSLDGFSKTRAPPGKKYMNDAKEDHVQEDARKEMVKMGPMDASNGSHGNQELEKDSPVGVHLGSIGHQKRMMKYRRTKGS